MGGGVFLCTKKYLQVLEELQLDADAELIWVKLTLLNQSSIHICAFYCPPNTESYPIEQLHLSITNLLNQSITPSYILLMRFQFSRYYLEWWLWPSYNTNCNSLFLDIINVHLPTRQGSILDLVFLLI